MSSRLLKKKKKRSKIKKYLLWINIRSKVVVVVAKKYINKNLKFETIFLFNQRANLKGFFIYKIYKS